MTCAEWLFSYGTLLDDATYARVTKCEPSPLVSATLHGWRRFDLPGASYPGAKPVAYPSRIEGALRYVCSVAQWNALDEYEGAEYTRVPCIVQTQHGPVSACVYRFELIRSLRVVVSDGPLAFEGLTQSRSTCADKKSQTYVALLNEIPVAALEIETHRHASGTSAWLAQLRVSSTLQRLGLGRALVERVLENLKHNGVESVHALPEIGELCLAALGWSSSKLPVGTHHRRVLTRKLA